MTVEFPHRLVPSSCINVTRMIASVNGCVSLSYLSQTIEAHSTRASIIVAWFYGLPFEDGLTHCIKMLLRRSIVEAQVEEQCCVCSIADLVNVFEVFLPQLLLYPNPTDPLNSDAASMLMRDPDAYNAKVKGGCHRLFSNSCISYSLAHICSAARPLRATLASIICRGLPVI